MAHLKNIKDKTSTKGSCKSKQTLAELKPVLSDQKVSALTMTNITVRLSRISH